MKEVQLFAVTASGSQALLTMQPLQSLHDLPDSLPFGVYTVFRTFEHNKFLGLADHLSRMEQSMAVLGWTYRPDRLAIRKALHEVCTAYPLQDARVRIDVLAAAAIELDTTSRVLLTLAPFEPVPAEYYTEGVRVALAPRLHRPQPLAKTADFVLARRDYPQGRPDAYEYLLLNVEREILEGSSSNFYGIRDGALWTAGDGVLHGITRKIVLELAAELNLPVHFRPVALDGIGRLDEAFISSSSRGLIPVVNIEGEIVGSGRPGPVTQQLMAVYNRFVAEAIRPALPASIADA